MKNDRNVELLDDQEEMTTDLQNDQLKKETIEKQSNGKFVISIFALLILIVMVIGVSMATFTFTSENEDEINTINTGNISLDFKEETNGINITNAYPMSDTVGKRLSNENQYFDFTVQSTIAGKAIATYEIAAEKQTSSTLNNNEVKLYLEKKTNTSYQEEMAPKVFTPLTKSTEIGTPAGTMLLATDKVSSTTSTSYRLRMWVDENVKLDQQVKTFAVQVIVNAKIDSK